jgi:sugar lactone lactonase YvrE
VRRGLNAAPIAAPLTGRGVPVSPPYPPVLNAVAFDARGTLYVPDYANARIQTWTPNATAWVTIIQGNAGPGAPDPADPARASAMAVAAGGTVYTINSYISELPGSVYKWAPGASTPVIIGTGLSGPLGIALSPQGYVYVVDGYPRVVRFDPSGPPAAWVSRGPA